MRQLLAQGKQQASWSELTVLVRPVRRWLIVIAGLAFLIGLAETALLVLLAELAVTLSAGGDTVTVSLGSADPGIGVGTALTIGIALVALRLGLRIMTAVTRTWMTTTTARRLRIETLQEYLAASWDTKANQRSGHLQDVMTTFVNRSVGALGQAAGIVSTAGTLFTLGISAFLLDWRFASLIVLFLVVMAALLRPFSRLVRVFNGRAARSNLRYVNLLSQTIGQAKEVEVYGVEAEIAAESETVVREFARERFRAGITAGVVPDLYQAVASGAVFAGLAALYLSGAGNFASLAAIILLFVRAGSYSTRLQAIYQGLQGASPYIARLRSARAEFTGSVPTHGDRPLEHVDTLAFDAVTYSYPGQQEALEEVSLAIDRGEMIGVVGPSGAGKSTLLQILLRLRSPDSGAYLVNDAPSDAYDTASWTNRVAFVPQEPTLLAGSIGDNVDFFRDLPRETIDQAISAAHLAQDPTSLPDGADTFVGDDGRRLSGGQRQRVAIARALAGAPDLVILDEPTSALDLGSEAAIQQTLAELHGSTTLIIVAHRLSTLTDCDRIIVLEDGRLAEFGPPDEVARRSTFYQQALELATVPGTTAQAS